MKKLAFIVSVLLTPFVVAQDSEGPTIEGGIQMNIQAAEDINAAVGNESEASQAIGAIESGEIVGDIEMGVTADGDINAAVGNKSCADQQIGSIGKKSTC